MLPLVVKQGGDGSGWSADSIRDGGSCQLRHLSTPKTKEYNVLISIKMFLNEKTVIPAGNLLIY